MLSGALGQIGSAPIASRTPVTAGSTSYSTSTASAALRAAKKFSATTIATASPG